ncbi:putative phosphatidylinositol-specific phospholipase C, X domain, von Willebrand factor, type A [Medicago truncatula]|uniref:Protein transport protein SEC23 n=1 Tax=Medicago truncatula TaxID=3880 RepID=A0A396ITU4_MEDTR|nr:putative phosphatidylinositol-specific phospholipase C, X domain, von Willebrand factor, type A [Medicago truncatula]
MSLSNKCGSIAYFLSTLHYTTWTNTACSKAGITVAIEDIHSTYNFKSRNRSTGVAFSAALGLLECCFVNTGSRIMVFASGPGLVLDSDFWQSMRTHNDIYICNGHLAVYTSKLLRGCRCVDLWFWLNPINLGNVEDTCLKMNFDATVEIMMSKSMELLDLAHLLGKRTVTDQTCIAFFFQASDKQTIEPDSASKHCCFSEG